MKCKFLTLLIIGLPHCSISQNAYHCITPIGDDLNLLNGNSYIHLKDTCNGELFDFIWDTEFHGEASVRRSKNDTIILTTFIYYSVDPSDSLLKLEVCKVKIFGPHHSNLEAIKPESHLELFPDSLILLATVNLFLKEKMQSSLYNDGIQGKYLTNLFLLALYGSSEGAIALDKLSHKIISECDNVTLLEAVNFYNRLLLNNGLGSRSIDNYFLMYGKN
jgi:hypothetical protein